MKLRLSDVVVSFGDRKILDRVSFDLLANDRVGVIGPNGAGKSTLLRAILGRIPLDSGEITFFPADSHVGWMPQVLAEFGLPADESVGEFLRSGRPLEQLQGKLHEIYIALEQSHDESQTPSLLKELEETQRLFDHWGGYTAQSYLDQVLAGIGIHTSLLGMRIGELSGGQKSKVAFARLLYAKPDVLLLDEPTNHLDVESREWIEDFLRGYPGLILTISHDEDFLESIVNKVLFVDDAERKCFLLKGSYRKALRQWEEMELARNRLADKQGETIRKLQDHVDSMKGVSGKRKKQAQSREKSLEKLKDTQVHRRAVSKKTRIALEPRRQENQIPIRVSNLHFGYLPGTDLLHGTSFVLQRGEKFVLVGNNGVGKSTLLKLIAGNLKPQSGEVIIGSNVDLGYYAQEHEGLDLNSSPLDEVRCVADLKESNLRAVLGQFLFSSDKALQAIGTLSPGERSRLALAKLTLAGANVLLLDEPTNHLDAVTRVIVAEAIRNYGGTVVVVSHDVEFLDKLGVGRMLVLPEGVVETYDPVAVERFYLANDTR